ncbi:MAG: hypothetical protein ACT4QG_17995 [Sporichthyaceae bacterium]
MTGSVTPTPPDLKLSSGVEELAAVRSLLAARHPVQRIGTAAAGQRIWQRPSAAVSEVWALSPSEEDKHRGLTDLRRQIEAAAATGQRIQSIQPNDASVALLLVTSAGGILLGSDLEHLPHPARGWKAVLANEAIPQARSGTWKVAHHGSDTGYCAGVWEQRLERDALAVLTPFELGRVKLPKESDVEVLLAHTNRCYLTSAASVRGVRRERAVERSISEAARSYRPLRTSMGHVQVRYEPDGPVVRGSSNSVRLSA